MSTALRVRVLEVVRETPDAQSLVLEPVEQHDQLGYRPGQFLTVRIPSDRPEGAARCYSLSSSPVHDEKPKVTVRRTAGGYGSNWLCDHVQEGSVLDVLRPSGTFTPPSLDEDLLLVAGGSGITPVMSILESCLLGGSGTVALVYANRGERSVIFADELHALVREHPERLTLVHWLESVQGVPTAAALQGLVQAYADRRAFVCGPPQFMDVVGTALAELGVPRDRIHRETFTSLTSDPFAVSEPQPSDDGAQPCSTVEVLLDGECCTVVWPRNRKLLDVLLDEGLDAPYSCRQGQCSACACLLLEGDVDLEHNEVLDEQDLADGIVLGCQAVPLTERVKVSYDA